VDDQKPRSSEQGVVKDKDVKTKTPKTTTTNTAGTATQEMVDPSMTLRTQYSRFLPPPPNAPLSRSVYLGVLEEVLGKYKAWRDSQGDEGEENGGGGEKEWVWLITPFICCLSRPGAIFFGFQRLMERMGKLFSFGYTWEGRLT
jgi:hypothetical protein